ncbi:hypothetical protein RND81_05G218200 [Saponaria officinalis]
MLRNCKVARALPRIADCAKNDKSAALRARCCDYALLVLEHWPDEPEIQRSADLYEDLIRRCVGDAVSEVRTTARACYRMFAKTWPERARRLFQSFDPVIQRIINEEDGGLHRRHASPSVRERHVSLMPQSSASLNLPGYGTSAIVAMDKTATLSSRASASSGMILSQSKSSDKGHDRSLESVLNSSKEKVSAIENLLRGLDMSSKHNSSIKSSSLDLGVDPPSSRDPPFPFAVPASNQVTNLSLDSKLSAVTENSHRNGSLAFSDMFSRRHASKDAPKQSYRSGLGNEPLPALSAYSAKRASERGQERSLIEELSDIRDARRHVNSHPERQFLDTPYRDSNFRDSQASHVPNFQRPLSRKNVTGRSISSSRRSFDDSHLPSGETPNYTEGPACLHDALSEGLSSTSDWSARVAAFNYIRSLLQQGGSGIQEVVQSFEKVMKLFFKHLDDPHHKVAQAALQTLADIIPSCRKPFESYMERILPHVFSRLIDPKELVRQPCSTTLDIVSKTYGVDSLLPALLRSLDEQRSPKAKLAVIEFSIGSFNKHSVTPEGAANYGILKLWLAKLTPLVHDKNTKLKEAAITCFISVFTHYDPTNVLNFILSLSVEEQNSLRRALKQYTPRIEVDLMNFLQNKKDRQRSKSSYDQYDIGGTSSEENYAGLSKKNHYIGRYSSNSLESDGAKKWNSTMEPTQPTQVNNWSNQASVDETHEQPYENLATASSNELLSSGMKDMRFSGNHTDEILASYNSRVGRADNSENMRILSSPCLDTNGFKSPENIRVSVGLQPENGATDNEFMEPSKVEALKITPASETGPSIPKILHLISNGDEGSPTSKNAALHQLIEASVSNDPFVWSKYFNQILTAVFEVLDDSDSSVKELALLLIAEMLKNQKDSIEDSVEIVIEKLLHVSKDTVPKVANEAENCLMTLLAHYDPFRCLSVIAPLLVTDDEKTLVSCINCLTKLVGRLTQEELLGQLPSFLPALFDAFGNQSADVRKTVVFCLVDMYILLGKAFLPYLEGLNSTQLRLVTIYANRISQARTGSPIDTTQ